MKHTGIGFIGSGDISLLHAKAIEHCPSAELVGLWSIDKDLDREKAEQFGCRTFDSAEALVSCPEINAVFVLSNLETHTRYGLMAMEAGKHVLIEKPVAPTVAELEQMKNCASAHDVALCPGHNYIHEPALHRTRELLSKGALGDLVIVYILYHIHHPEEVAKRYPGVIRHILTHHGYILSYLAGPKNPPESVSAMSSVLHYDELEREDLAMVNLRLRSGALAHFCADFAADDHSADPWTFLVKVIGTDGATRFSYRDWVENKPGVVHSHTWSAYEHHIREEVRYFVEECIGHGAQAISTVDDAILCQKIIEAAELSILEKREVSL